MVVETSPQSSSSAKGLRLQIRRLWTKVLQENPSEKPRKESA
jgi:hypothetical protein